MRFLLSTNESVTPDLDEETREALAALAQAGAEMRSSYSTDSHGHKAAEVWLRGYDTTDGQERWAVISTGPDYSDVSDTANWAEAEKAYEEEVRTLADCAGEDDAPWWTSSDVKGIPQAAYTLLIQRERHGEWEEQEMQACLGRVPTLPYQYYSDDGCVPTTLEGAAREIAAVIARQQADTNDSKALMDALGIPIRDESAQTIRVTITGIGAGGEETHTEERQIPTVLPTEEDLERHRRAERQEEQDQEDDASAYEDLH
ncbi:hypothetical protein ACFYNX_26050 [Streptomyces sp. NPDC007872]|uniref:hypothetical protein n=1 Tax=Streptomyces sp. NPDC007872 TaxID=3364782 RepID=UPI00369B6824